MTAPLYTREILRLAASIPYLEPFDELEGAAELRSPTCGSRMRVAVELDWANRVVRIRQAVEACAFGQATAALMGGHAIGRNAEEAATALESLAEHAHSSWPALARCAADPHPLVRQRALSALNSFQAIA